ncbi:MAG: hypothetical protein Kow0089_19490 [Desulfobulbaceae bacterium]
MGMDSLDKLTILGIAALVIYTAVLLFSTDDQVRAGMDEKKKAAVAVHVLTPELETKIRTARSLLQQDNLDKSMSLVESLLSQYPYEGELYLLRGDILVRRQQPVAAMYEYREAISLNPDYLDKKTPRFQGKKIKNTVEEAMTAIQAGLVRDPGNSKLKADREVVYYMKRKIAGSCG